MGLIIEWSELSEKQLKAIFDYYSLQANPKTALKIVSKIIDRVSILQKNPNAGPIEELLVEYKEEYRYLVESNYKIIYWIHENKIIISSIFDCRQNPIKIKRL